MLAPDKSWLTAFGLGLWAGATLTLYALALAHGIPTVASHSWLATGGFVALGVFVACAWQRRVRTWHVHENAQRRSPVGQQHVPPRTRAHPTATHQRSVAEGTSQVESIRRELESSRPRDADASEAITTWPQTSERQSVDEPKAVPPDLAPHAPSPDRLSGELLVEVWTSYRDEGRGRLSASGFVERLADRGVTAQVIDRLSTEGLVAIVDPYDHDAVFLVPEFTRSPHQLTPWFDWVGARQRQARISRMLTAARARRRGGILETISKGSLE